MRESLAQLYRDLLAGATASDVACEDKDYATAQESLKKVMGAASRLYARLTVLQELADDAKFVAEVDRALARERKSRPAAIPGDTLLPFPPPGKASTPRKGKPGR